MNPILRQQSPEASLDLPPTPDVPLVSKYTHPHGMNFVKVEAVSLVTGLAGTGSDPPPSPQRAALLDDMKRRNVANANEVLASPNTSLVLVRAYLRPGIQAGERLDGKNGRKTEIGEAGRPPFNRGEGRSGFGVCRP
jgi:hypothetical protein